MNNEIAWVDRVHRFAEEVRKGLCDVIDEDPSVGYRGAVCKPKLIGYLGLPGGTVEMRFECPHGVWTFHEDVG